LELKERNHRLVILITAKITKRPSTSNAALSIRISCVLGSTSLHTKAQSTAISDIRKMNERRFLNISILYPILTKKVKQKVPILT